MYGMGIAHRSAKPHRTSVSRKPPIYVYAIVQTYNLFAESSFVTDFTPAGWQVTAKDHLVFRPVHRHLGLGRVSCPAILRLGTDDHGT